MACRFLFSEQKKHNFKKRKLVSTGPLPSRTMTFVQSVLPVLLLSLSAVLLVLNQGDSAVRKELSLTMFSGVFTPRMNVYYIYIFVSRA